MMKVSVIMPSFLGVYDGAASDREEKFIRAINSFLDNDYQSKELIVVGDACDLTAKILKEIFSEQLSAGTIKFHQFKKKQPLFSGNLRSKGIEVATGNIIMYLDSDDIYGNMHIRSVVTQIESKKVDWCYFNDFFNTPTGLVPKTVELQHKSIGTSSIAHLKAPSLDWNKCDGYGHDWTFVQKLMAWSNNWEKIYGTCYLICHIPNQLDQ